MEPNQNAVHDSGSRIYSLARMKRRARQVNKENSGVWLYTNKEAASTAANCPVPSNTVCYLSKRDNAGSSPEAVANKSEVPFEKPSSGTMGVTVKPLSWKEFSYSSIENVLNRRCSFAERVSVGSSGGSNNSVRGGNSMSGDAKLMSAPVKQTQRNKILATLLPNEILNDPVSRKPRPYDVAIMFPDVSGFTQLCQKYDKTGKGGPSRLTEVLNGYIGSMIDIVLSRNGDVCKFGGDAFLCMWKVTDDVNIMQIVHSAIDSAVDIQKKCGEHKTDVGVKLRVKIAVAAGKAVFSIIGAESRKYYVIAGTPIIEARDAEQLCGPGDVIVAPSAWKYVSNYMFYSYTYHSDNNHIKVQDFGPLWKPSKMGLKNLDRGGQSSSSQPLSKHVSRMRMEDIRPFILPAVMKSIDMNQSLDYLTEMRQVAIVFFNVAVDFKSLTLDHLLKLTNKTFQVIAAVVDKSGGATNKLTLFDKDMAILAVFGLKGFKHELASQVALKCAYSCLEQLTKMEIFSVSAGVTTGMAYCGVIGHKLRKEYTVMGNPVNLAARLMCAYKNIVSTDRETFLYSKLESSHFEVLEQQNLKGIQSSGPFYRRTKIKFDQDAHPLLGRGKEIIEFEVFLRNSMKRKDAANFMIIFGEARIGKSRLLSRLVNITEKYVVEGSEISVRRRRTNRKRNHPMETVVVSLTEDESKVPYSTSRLIFQHFLGLSELSSMEERRDQILSRLVEVKDLFVLASLNQVFNVNFEFMPQYLALSEEDQTSVRKTLVKNLYSKCRPKGNKWLVAIDDAEFIDDESWNLLMWCSEESDRALYLLTVGQRKALTRLALNCLGSISAIKITLTEIDKWYFAGLACQILEVRAVPLELIKWAAEIFLLQTHKSSGNPGWLESFLLSLLQSGRIYVDQMPPDRIKSMGLVTVPVIMLSRNVTVEVEKFDNSYWMDCLETFEQISDLNEIMRVCLLGPNFLTANDTETELTMDVMFIKTIDTLYPLQQLILKAGSVLGNNLKRSALKFLISKDTQLVERKLAKAIKHLFEIKILSCAKSDQSQSNLLIPRKMITSTLKRKEVTCECIGLNIPPDCRDLPKYANCGYMQFVSPTFRDTLYNLLLDDQKKKFHHSCLEFLVENTYKCKSCHSMPFTNILGYKKDGQTALNCTNTPMHGIRSTQLNPRSVFPMPSLKHKLISCTILNTVNQIRRSTQISENDLKLISGSDKGDCQCAKILSSVYSVLLEHAAGCGRKDLMLEIQLEHASVSLTTNNVPLNMQILEEALTLVNQMRDEKEYPEFCIPYIYGKIYTLMGAMKLNMGRPLDSLELLTMSLKCLKKNFPRSDAAVRFSIKKHILKRKFMMEFPENYIGRASDAKAPFLDLLSECLGVISLVHVYLQNWSRAKCASVWALNQALQSNRNFFGLCTAYTNVMDMAYRDNDTKTCARMEVCAVDICRRCSTKIIEVYELEAVCRLYRVIFQTRYVRAEIEEAAQIGFQSIKIASKIRSTALRLDLTPDLILALIQLNRLSEAVTLLHELEFMSLVESDKSSKVWYHAICLDFQLDTGFTVLPFEACEGFAKEEENLVVRDANAKHRLYTSIWLWCVRNDEWELSKPYWKALKDFSASGGKESPCSVSTLLKRLEGCLITLVHRIDSRNIYWVNATYAEVHSLMNKLEKDVETVKLLKPRYQVLKAYYRQIRYRDNSYSSILNQALSQAEKMKDRNTSQWIIHLKMVWTNTISPIQRTYWVQHSRDNLIDWHESDKSKKLQAVMYSLPLPRF